MAVPLISGPDILPIPKAIPAKIFPAGSKYFGNKSAIYEIPRENKEPTSIPATRKQSPSKIGDVTKMDAKKEAVPPNKRMDKICFRPNLSLNIPSGTCEIKLPATNVGKRKETC